MNGLPSPEQVAANRQAEVERIRRIAATHTVQERAANRIFWLAQALTADDADRAAWAKLMAEAWL